jgi:hypothetical protein
MYTNHTGFYAVEVYNVSGNLVGFYDNYKRLELARKAAKDSLKDQHPGSKAVILQDTAQGWIEKETLKG